MDSCCRVRLYHLLNRPASVYTEQRWAFAMRAKARCRCGVAATLALCAISLVGPRGFSWPRGRAFGESLGRGHVG